MRRILTVSIVALAAAFSGPAGAEILIGGAGPNTGPLAWIGEQMQRGAEMAVADINAAGGVLGQPVKLITVDDFCGSRSGRRPRRRKAGQRGWRPSSTDIIAQVPRSRRVRDLTRPRGAADHLGVDQSAID